jgi:hypothetical protein
VNNAGVVEFALFEELSTGDIHKIFVSPTVGALAHQSRPPELEPSCRSDGAAGNWRSVRWLRWLHAHAQGVPRKLRGRVGISGFHGWQRWNKSIICKESIVRGAR